MTLQTALAQAIQHHQAGRLAEAETLYREILALHPDHPDALQLLGVIAGQTGRIEAAIDLVQRAIQLRPDAAEYHVNLGQLLEGSGRLDAAFATYRTALDLKPTLLAARMAAAGVLLRAGRFADAAAAYREITQLRPDLADAHTRLGYALKCLGRRDEALAALRQAVRLNPVSADAHNNLGIVLQELRRRDDAAAAFHEALRLRPNYAEVRNNLGVLWKSDGQLAAAIEEFQAALALKPDYVDARHNLAASLSESGRGQEAIEMYRSALALRPGDPAILLHLGSALQQAGALDAAVEVTTQALQLDPQSAEAHRTLGNAYKDRGELDAAIAHYRAAVALRPEDPSYGDNLLMTLHYHPQTTAAQLFTEHRAWRQRHGDPLQRFVSTHGNDRAPERRLRIGYVSGDFRQHAVARFMLPVLQHHDRTRYEVFCYSETVRPDATTALIRELTHGWRETFGHSDAEVTDQIIRDQIDILIDLAAHSHGNRLLVFARKPAPVQVTYLAYAGSTGLDTIDYRLSDRFLDPPGTDLTVYSEQTVTLPETYWCYGAPEITAAPSPLPAASRGYITFGCLNNFCKINAQVTETWAKLLGQVPGSRLVLHAHPGSHRDALLRTFAAQGVDPTRIEFIGHCDLAGYFAWYQSIDIALDPFPYAGGTTTCDALWMGVPVVTLSGAIAVGRAGASLLANVGLPQLIARSREQYVQIAADLARNHAQLAGWRATLRAQMQASPLMDAPRFARHLESTYRALWHRWCETPTPS